jgi:hypothetical protein
MEFLIQANNPRPSNLVSPDDSSLGEAIETIFPLHTDFVLLGWNNVYVPLTYKYDISVIINDIIAMLNSIVARDEGSITVFWPSNTFRTRWILTWTATELAITTAWESVIGGTESMLNKVPSLNIDKQTFLSEWKPLLQSIKTSILMMSGTVDTTFMLADLDSILSRLPVGKGDRGLRIGDAASTQSSCVCRVAHTTNQDVPASFSEASGNQPDK